MIINALSLQASSDQMAVAKEMERAHQEARACGNDMRCRQDKMSEIFKLFAKIQQSSPNTKVKTQGCGDVMVAGEWDHCLPLKVEINLKSHNKKYGSYSKDFKWYRYFHKEERIGYKIITNGVLSYDKNLNKFFLHTPLPHHTKDIKHLDFIYRFNEASDGSEVIKTKTKSDINWQSSDLTTMLSIGSDSPKKSGYIKLSGMKIIATNPWDGNSVSPPGISPDGMRSDWKGDEGVFPMIKPSQIKVTRKELRRLINGKTWKRKLQWNRKWDKYGSFDHLNIDLIITPKTVKPKKPGKLVVMPKSDFKASKKRGDKHYKPKKKTYTLKNVGKSSLDYSIGVDKNWITLSQTNGKLQAGQSTNVTVGLHDSTAKFKDAHNEAKVTFSDISSGKNTQRKVILKQSEKWMYSLYGYDVVYFGGHDLAGGIKVNWRMDITFIVEDGKYKNGKGRTYFTKIGTYSNPPGAFECDVIKGTYISKSLKDKETPYIHHKNFSVPGSIRDGYVTLQLPKENFWLVDYMCYSDGDAIKKWYGKSPKHPKWLGKVLSDRVRKSASLTDARPLPFKKQIAPLKNGWSEVIEKRKFIGSARKMKQLE